MFGIKLISAKKVAVLTAAILSIAALPSFADNITVDGKSRSMLVYAPSGIEKNRPLIIQMQGGVYFVVSNTKGQSRTMQKVVVYEQ